MDVTAIHRARFADLTPQDLYDLLRLRSEVFVVEQDCVFLDLDGRDHETDALHLWIRDEKGIAATARVLGLDAPPTSIGRVVTRPDARGSGAASALMRAAIEVCDTAGAREVHLGAQSHLADWYGRFGFEVDGPEYVEDDIPHVPMRRHEGSPADDGAAS